MVPSRYPEVPCLTPGVFCDVRDVSEVSFAAVTHPSVLMIGEGEQVPEA